MLSATCQLSILPLSPCWLMWSSVMLQKSWGGETYCRESTFWFENPRRVMTCPQAFGSSVTAERSVASSEPSSQSGFSCWRLHQQFGWRGLQRQQAYMAAERVECPTGALTFELRNMRCCLSPLQWDFDSLGSIWNISISACRLNVLLLCKDLKIQIIHQREFTKNSGYYIKH